MSLVSFCSVESSCSVEKKLHEKVSKLLSFILIFFFFFFNLVNLFWKPPTSSVLYFGMNSLRAINSTVLPQIKDAGGIKEEKFRSK